MKHAFGLFVSIDVCLELDNIMGWLELGNYHHLSPEDWQRLQALANRCTMLGFEDEMRLDKIMSHNPHKQEN